MISFERIAELMGVPSASFIDTYNNKVIDLMVNIVQYVQAMDEILHPTRGQNDGTSTGTGTGIGPDALPTNKIIQKSTPLERNVNGYPMLPDPIPSDGWLKTTWDSLFSDYIGQQYHLACGGTTKHIPYKRISENQLEFIENKYLPRKTTFRSPRNIPMQEMISIFDHLLQRQRTHGPEDTFTFKSIKFKGKTVPANYPKNINEENSSQNDPETHPMSRPIGSIASSSIGPVRNSGPVATVGPDTLLGSDEPDEPLGTIPYLTPRPTPTPNANSPITEAVAGGDLSQSPTKPRPRPRPITRKKN